VALPTLNTAGHGQVAVINVAVDPDLNDPRVKIIDLGHADVAGGVAINPTAHLVMVTSGFSGNGGFLDLINENSLSLISGSPFPFPAGADSEVNGGTTGLGAAGQVLYDAVNNAAIVSTGDAKTCKGAAGTCTGFASFNLSTRLYSPVIQAAQADAFALDASTGTIIAPADDIDPGGQGTGVGMDAIDLANSAGCIISDANVTSLAADPDDASYDPTTHLVVIGNSASPMATVINLNGSTFNELVTPCMLNEGGTPPNSVNIDTGTGGDMPGVAVNPVTHQAFLTEYGGPHVALLGLPTSTLSQLTAANVSALANSSIPNTPAASSFQAKSFPYATAVDATNNFGYVLNGSFDFLVQIDLATLQSDPSAISTALPAGTCAGLSTGFVCDNGNGVKFYAVK
jgi:hypothetical protein